MDSPKKRFFFSHYKQLRVRCMECVCVPRKKIDLGFEYSITLFLASLLVSCVFLDSTPRSVSNENFALYFLHLQEKSSIYVLVLFDKSITH